ncbi:MAG: histidine phosphatase family protein [Acetatifactor sp.]|nr:histidine phosphatase family protein [Acetatifactor sp.]
MKIIMIRHEKVDMFWKQQYNSSAYDLACMQYDQCPIVISGREYIEPDDTATVYISELSRTYETACRIFQKTDFLKTPLLNEVPLKSFRDTDKPYPLWLWNIAGRLQWILQSNRQAESRHQTILRAKELIALLESRQEDCYLITHGFYLRTLIRELKKQGYRIRKSSPLGISNLDRITAVR